MVVQGAARKGATEKGGGGAGSRTRFQVTDFKHFGSLVEAPGLAASRVLQIDEGELSGWWTPVMGGRADEAPLYLYDLLPGGAGYARSVGNDLPEVLDAAEALLGGCDCPSSCYRCIRHYGNNWIHASLDRHLALALLRHLRTGELPSLTDQDKDRALVALRQSSVPTSRRSPST